jgi:hypothetical protein
LNNTPVPRTAPIHDLTEDGDVEPHPGPDEESEAADDDEDPLDGVFFAFYGGAFNNLDSRSRTEQ